MSLTLQKLNTMDSKTQILLLLPLAIINSISTNSLVTKADDQPYSTGCNRTCGSNQVPFPFGFSSGCPIHLNCTQDGLAVINEFPVQVDDSISKFGKLKISLEAKCNRPVEVLEDLYTENYAPTNRNAILFSDCISPSTCNLPSIDIETSFRSLHCSTDSNISCFSNVTQDTFFDYKSFINSSHCKYLLSSISAESVDVKGPGVSLDIQVMVLEWWLPGMECKCDKGADCTHLNTPNGTGFRCQCRDGMRGDGYLAGEGCRKECNAAKYLSGQCGGERRIAVFVGGIAVCAALVTTMALLCCVIRRRRSNLKTKGYTKRQLVETSGIMIPIHPYKEIERATNGFSVKQRLGTGAYGTVYAGKLNNDSWVAIKRIKHRDTDSVEQVMNEIKLISSVSHPNLVRLLGCSIENGEQILVYEFMPNGTLCQHLQRERGDGLSWPVRLTIAAETAQAIAHLHSAIDPPIYHRDIKSSNILLDYNYRSKVADFGLSRLGMTETSHISTAPQGTPGYVDPQYHQNFHLSDKSDVYSFGVVLVEIITALKVVDFSRPQNEVNLAALAADRIAKGKVVEIIDPFLDLHANDWTLSSVHKVAELAFRCLSYQRDMRPSMMEVAAELEQIRIDSWVSPEEKNCSTSSLEESNCSSSSNLSEKPLSLEVDKPELGGRGLSEAGGSLNSIERMKENSPVSVQDPWLSEQSSPSSSSLLSNAAR